VLDGVADVPPDEVEQRVQQAMWTPDYAEYVAV
jgi:hypothetical protein